MMYKMEFLVQLFVFYLLFKYCCCEKIWHSNYLDLSSKSRNDFNLKEILIEESFSLNLTINFWKSLNLKHVSHVIGIADDKIIILNISEQHQNGKLHIQSSIYDLNEVYVDASIRKMKNNVIVVTLITAEGLIDFFDISNGFNFWSWNTGYRSESIKLDFNTVSKKTQLFVGLQNNLLIYELDTENHQKWLIERIEFNETIGSFDTITHHKSYFLLIPRRTTGKISIYVYSKTNHHFQHFQTLESPDIEQVVTFQHDFKSFFAINGFEPKLYQIGKRNRISKEIVAHTYLEGVKHWLPVKLNTIRGNIALFGQRFLEHGTHNNTIMEIFTYNENHFEEHEDIPCTLFGEKLNSVDCFFTNGDSIKLNKAAFVHLRYSSGIFMPGKQEHKLFLIKFENKLNESPLRIQMEKLNGIMDNLEKLVDEKLNSTYDTIDAKILKVDSAKPISAESLRTSAAISFEGPIKIMSRNNDEYSGKLDKILVDLNKMKQEVLKKLIRTGVLEVENLEVEEISSGEINGEPANFVLEDIVRKDRNNNIKGTKTFTDLQVENLNFESVNGMKASDLMFKTSELIVNGNIKFEKPVSVMENIKVGVINNLPTSSILNVGKKITDSLIFEDVSAGELETSELNKLPLDESWIRPDMNSNDTIFIPHNLTVKKINGDDFESLLKELCLVNVDTNLPGKITVHGDILVENESDIQYLNTIKFPENFFFTDNSGGVLVAGQKTFEKSLNADGIRTNQQYVNGIRTSELFTTSTPQEIPGRITFTNLEVTEKFEHDGITIGDNIDKFLPNPTLLKTKLIKSNVNFADLEVTGSVIISNDLNTENYGETLIDIVYKNEENPSMNSIKEFPEGLTVRKNLNITSNSINLVPLDQIVTKDTNQILNIPQLNGNVSVENMEIKQLIDGINITKLEEETAKISGEQYISSFLIFKEDLEVNNLEILEKLNEVFVNEFHTTTNDTILNFPVNFTEFDAETLVINGDFSGKIQDFDLENFEKNRLSYSTPQNISTEFVIENSNVKKIKCNKISGEECGNIFEEKSLLETVTKKISMGSVKVKKLICEDELEIENLQGDSLVEPSEITGNSVVIKGNVFFPHLEIGKLSKVDFQAFFENVVFKNETDIELRGSKYFKNGFQVKKLLETDKINTVPIESILTKQGSQIITSPIEIYGNVTFSTDVFIENTINGISMEDLKNYLEMNDDIYIIKGSIIFDRLSYIDNLEILGQLNGKNVQQVLQNMVYDNDKVKLTQETQFFERLTIKGNMDIEEHLNDIDLSEINENVVYVGETENNIILSPISFTQPEIFVHNLVVETNLNTKYLFGNNLESWLQDAIFVNKGFLKGVFKFENVTIHEKLMTKMINNINLNQTIPLSTDQDISQLNFKNVIFLNDVEVDNLVNGFNLSAEYEKSVLSNKEQEILSEVHFKNNTLIRNNLEIDGYLNDLPLNKIVTIDTDQNLTALYELSSKITLESNLYVSGFVNSINMSKWEYGAVKMISQEPQDIEAPWHIYGNLTFQDDLQAEIYDFDISDKLKFMEEQKSTQHALKEQHKEDREKICKDFDILSREMKKRIFKFDSFELIQSLEQSENVAFAVHFFMNNDTLLLINGERSCESDVFIFKNPEFVKITSIDIGEIDQIVTVKQRDSTFLIVKNRIDSVCIAQGTNVWKFDNKFAVEKIRNIENQHLLQESLVPLTFYGLNKQGVTEFKINEEKTIPVFPYRKWKLAEENMAFVPRGLGTGLAIRTGTKLIQLIRNEPVVEDNDVGIGSFLRGDIKIFENLLLPGRDNNNLQVFQVGSGKIRNKMIAVVFYEDTVVKTHKDVIKIYEDYTNEKPFQKISTYNPSSITSLEFSNGETLLLVLENSEKFQVYEYKGIEGFKRRLTADFPGTKMFKMKLRPNDKAIDVIGIIHENKISVIKPVMLGYSDNGVRTC